MRGAGLRSREGGIDTADFVKLTEDGGSITVLFNIEDETVMALGERLAEICADAYMNGYNWDALLVCYLDENAPDLLNDLDSDPEAGMYTAIYPDSPENRKRADQLCEIIEELCENEDAIAEFVQEFADEIAWE